MRSPGLVGCAGALILVGCQWVLPIHEVSDAGDASPPSDGAASDSSTAEASSNDAMSCDMPFTGDPTCDECVNATCCPEITQCFGGADKECAAIQSCIEQCGITDFQCPPQCVSAHPQGQNDYGRLVDCSKSKPCSSACDAG
jgi:hypothetical protein